MPKRVKNFQQKKQPKACQNEPNFPAKSGAVKACQKTPTFIILHVYGKVIFPGPSFVSLRTVLYSVRTVPDGVILSQMALGGVLLLLPEKCWTVPGDPAQPVAHEADAILSHLTCFFQWNYPHFQSTMCFRDLYF